MVLVPWKIIKTLQQYQKSSKVKQSTAKLRKFFILQIVRKGEMGIEIWKPFIPLILRPYEMRYVVIMHFSGFFFWVKIIFDHRI